MVCVKADSLMCGVALVAAIICVLIDDSGAADTDVGQQAGPSNLPAVNPPNRASGKRKAAEEGDTNLPKKTNKSEKSGKSGKSSKGTTGKWKVIPDKPDYGDAKHFDLWEAAIHHENYTAPPFSHDNSHYNPFNGDSFQHFNWTASKPNGKEIKQITELFSNLEGLNFMEYDSRMEGYGHLEHLCRGVIARRITLSIEVFYFLFGALGGYMHAARKNVPESPPFVQQITLAFFEKHDLYDIIPPELDGKLQEECNIPFNNLPDSASRAMATLKSKVSGKVKHPVAKNTVLKNGIAEISGVFANTPTVRNENPLKTVKEQVIIEIMALICLFFQLTLYQAGATEDNIIHPEEFEPVAQILEEARITALWPSFGFPEYVVPNAFLLFRGIFRYYITLEIHVQVYKELMESITSVRAKSYTNDNFKESACYLVALLFELFEASKLPIDHLLIEVPTFVIVHSLARPQIIPNKHYPKLMEYFSIFIAKYKAERIASPKVISLIAHKKSGIGITKDNGEKRVHPHKAFIDIANENLTELEELLEHVAKSLAEVMAVVSLLARIAFQIAFAEKEIDSYYRALIPNYLVNVQNLLNDYYKKTI